MLTWRLLVSRLFSQHWKSVLRRSHGGRPHASSLSQSLSAVITRAGPLLTVGATAAAATG